MRRPGSGPPRPRGRYRDRARPGSAARQARGAAAGSGRSAAERAGAALLGEPAADDPAGTLRRASEPQEPRFWELVCHSPAMHLALQAVAARTRADSGHVLLAAYAVALARVTGRSPSVAQVIGEQPVPARLRRFGEPSDPAGICVVDVADAAFDEVVARAWKAAPTPTCTATTTRWRSRRCWPGSARARARTRHLVLRQRPSRRRAHPSPPAPRRPRRSAPRCRCTTIRWDRNARHLRRRLLPPRRRVARRGRVRHLGRHPSPVARRDRDVRARVGGGNRAGGARPAVDHGRAGIERYRRQTLIAVTPA